jgi:hypothetical protein
VGSTLLSRLIGQHQAFFSLREPAVLRLLAEVHWTLEQPDCPWNIAEFADRLRAYLALWSRTFEPSQTAVIKATSFVSEMAARLMDQVSTARSVFMTVGPEVFLRALLGGAMSDVDRAVEKRLARLHRRLGGCRWRADDLSPGERVGMSWLSEIAALNDAASKFPDRVLWLDFDRFLDGPTRNLASVLDHFGAAESAKAANTILAGPTMHQYAKAPAHSFDAGVRRQILEDSGRQHAVEVSKGLAWLDRATEFDPVRAVLDRFAGQISEAVPC